MKKFFTLFFSLSTATAFAQAPGIDWQKTFGGTGPDMGYSAQQTFDGGYIFGGTTQSNDGDVSGNYGSADYWLMKTDAMGTILWKKTYGSSDYEGLAKVEQTADSGFVMIGTTGSLNTTANNGDVYDRRGDRDFWVVKTTSNGTIQWAKCLGGRYDEFGSSIHQTADGGYIVSGFTSSSNGDVAGGGFHAGGGDAWVLKLNDTGKVEWNKCLGGGGYDYGRDARQTADGGYIVSALTGSADGDVSGNRGGFDGWVVKLDNTGRPDTAPRIQWQRCIGGSNIEDAYAVQQTQDGGYVVAAKSNSTDGDVTVNFGGDDYWIVKLDGGGALTWQKSLGGSSSEAAQSIHEATGGGYLVAGYSLSNDGNVSGHRGSTTKNDYWVLKLSSSGNLVWQTSLGGSDDDYGYSVEPTADGGYILGGYTYSTDGDVTSRHTDAEYWIVKLKPDPTAVSDLTMPEGFSLSPNPATTEVHIHANEIIRSVQVTDISGKEVFRAGATDAIPTATLANGLYLVRVQTANGATTQKLVIQH